jgi:hypothetical protein
MIAGPIFMLLAFLMMFKVRRGESSADIALPKG